MVDAARSIIDYFNNKTKGGIGYINVMSNISLYCDCFGEFAPEPRIKDIGILASNDPVALDQACLDLIKKSKDNGTDDLLQQIKNLNGEKIIDYAKEHHHIGIKEYNFIDIDDEKKTIYGLILFLCIIFGSILIAGILAFCFTKHSKKSKESKSDSLVEQKEEE